VISPLSQVTQAPLFTLHQMVRLVSMAHLVHPLSVLSQMVVAEQQDGVIVFLDQGVVGGI